MHTTSISRPEEEGAVLDLRSGEPFYIQDPEKIWLVLEGKLDLFLVEAQKGQPSGARHHLMRVEAGGPVIGFPEPADAAVAFIANPVAASKALCMGKAQLRQAESCASMPAIPLIEKWIENLGSAASGQSAPKAFHQLEPGGIVGIEDKPAAILPLNGVVWVRHLQGTAVLWGDDEMPPLRPGSFFPVSRAAWLQCSPHTQVECIHPDRLTGLDAQWSGLRNFQEQLFTYLVLRHRRRMQRETERIQRVTEADARLFESALYTLAAPLRGEDKELPAPETTAIDRLDTLDTLQQVCRIVGSATGIQIRPVPRAPDGSRKGDPVAAIAQASRVRMRQVILKGKWWNNEGGAMVGFHGDDKRPVALLPRRRRGYQIYDPQAGGKVPVTEEAARALHGLAYVFYRPFPCKAVKLHEILAFGLKDCRADLLTTVGAGVAVGLLGIATPIFTGIIFDTVIPGAEHRTLAEFALFLAISAVATALFSLTRAFATLRLEGRMEASIQAAVWDRLLDLSVPFFRNFSAGDLARRSLGISQIRQALTGSVLSSMLTGIFSIAACGLMFYYSWRLALIATGLVAFSFLVFTLCGYIQVRLLRHASELGGRLAGMTLQFINGVPKFRVAGTEARAFVVWAREFGKQRFIAMKARRISNAISIFNSAFPVLAWAAIFYYAAALTKTPDSKALSTGQFLAFLAAFVQFSTGALELSSALISVANVVPLYERAKPILTSLPEVHGAKADPGELMGNIDIHHVSFRYRRDGPLALRDVSIAIPSGQFVAFVGPSGSGKSTLLRLLLGFEKTESGAIYYEEQDLGELDVQAVRRQIGVVLQNGKITAGSVFDKIVEGRALTIDDAWQAARMAGLDEDLKAMPMGMHTVVSEGGGGLSGGQRQRLLIARAIAHRPRIILFDEATSALDNRTQAVVSQSLKTLNATRVVIAHRLTTVMHADRICVLDKGNLVESGTYDELIARGGLFSELARRQLS